jgi:putative spermidine/putrescine transport system permease protein
LTLAADGPHGRPRRFEGSTLAAALLLAPAALLFLGLFVYPQFHMLAVSLGAPHWSVGSYVHFLTDTYYLGVLLRSLVMGVVVTAVTLALGVPLAYWLARMDSRLAPVLLLLSTFPLWVSAVVRSFAWVILLGRSGLVPGVARSLGLADQFYQLLYTFGGVVIALAQVMLPLMVLSLYGLIRGIDPELERAAQNLGASPCRAALLTTLPLARHGMLSASLLIFALTISAFATPSLVGGARVHVMSTTIYEQMTELADWRFASTVAFILMVVVLAIVLVNTRLGGTARDGPAP